MSIALGPATPRLLALAARLAARGAEVHLVEPDAHDARRARDLLARRGLAVPVVGRAPRGVLTLIRETPPPRAPRGALVIALDPAALPARGCAVVDLPAPDLSLAEVLQGSDPRGAAVLEAAGIPCLSVPAFVGRGLMAALEDAAEALVLGGATPDEVDTAAEGAGFALGPCAAMDLRGLDTVALRQARGTTPRLPLIARMVAEGRLGRAAGVGWYRYPGGGGRVIDPLIEDMAIEEARFAHLPRAALAPRQIADRLQSALRAAAAPLPADLVIRVSAALGLPETP